MILRRSQHSAAGIHRVAASYDGYSKSRKEGLDRTYVLGLISMHLRVSEGRRRNSHVFGCMRVEAILTPQAPATVPASLVESVVFMKRTQMLGTFYELDKLLSQTASAYQSTDDSPSDNDTFASKVLSSTTRRSV